MNESHPIRVTGHDLGSVVPNIAALFKQVLTIHAGAMLRITGSSTLAAKVQDRLRDIASGDRFQIVAVTGPQYNDSVDVVIVFFPIFGPPVAPANGKRKVPVQFKLDLEALPITVDFEVSSDGTVEEIKAQWYPLKAKIREYALNGRVKNIKIATKIEGVALFDRQAAGNFETALKAKIRSAFSADVLFGNQMINIEFYGAAAMKFKGDETKSIFEGGFMLTVPHNLL